MYCIFVLLLPAVIGGLENGRRWLVLSVSLAVWAVAQVAPIVDPGTVYPIITGSFNPFGWQLLFVGGVVIGNARFSGREQVARPSPWVMVPAAVVAVYGIGLHYFDQWPRPWPDDVFGFVLYKPALGLFRIADFACIAYFAGILAARFPSAFNVRALALLGRHSLAVVAAQSVIVITLLQFPGLSDTEFDRTATVVATVALLFAVAEAHEAFQERRASARGAIGTRQPGAPGLIPPNEAHAARAPGAVYPGGRQVEGGLSADPMLAERAPGERRRALVAPVLGGDRLGGVRERAAH
jgi:hypothetical protein